MKTPLCHLKDGRNHFVLNESQGCFEAQRVSWVSVSPGLCQLQSVTENTGAMRMGATPGLRWDGESWTPSSDGSLGCVHTLKGTHSRAQYPRRKHNLWPEISRSYKSILRGLESLSAHAASWLQRGRLISDFRRPVTPIRRKPGL